MMLRRSAGHAAKNLAGAGAVVTKTSAAENRNDEVAKATATHTRKPLLPYALRRASAYEMLYGGARVQYLIQHPFQLHTVRSEDLPSPSLDAERHDLALEMQLPRDLGPYNNINMNIQRQAGADVNVPDAAADRHTKEGFDMGAFFSDQHHPERHHNSSLPYSQHDTNNVMGLRLFPLNIGVRARTEAVRIRTDDCLQRLRVAKLCAQAQQPLEYPLPLHRQSRYASVQPAMSPDRTAHLRGAAAHPTPSQLSIFTRPVDRVDGADGEDRRHSPRVCPVHPFAVAAVTRAWLPLQMLKPMGHNWSAATRSSGTRGPHMQLMQERLDQKGFGWKRKSRSLWQQDVATAGFRPHRYF
ncbi:putative mitochondrial hypothetical protein [Leptomonas pyrrhocoris]|uniref:Uncharacterized protein n=1 Tax=Leptomonas pyrrhocoris TaxID=157538 RepID=A0A0N0DXF4_LEPPY|nr:putative mitochondrial hypothetical protein [Leptomonas pyrrhocoris]KPA82892.1 putative mitochondrial hypothetical protein [Leptomonas pyrrhocoris]|eukprot:XP_015661331.1 putative mitochondrial hypothetical protein [Leptomonas pyrrhocoris]